MNRRTGKAIRLGVVGVLVAATAVAGAAPSTAAPALTDYPGSLPATSSAVTYCVVADVRAELPEGCTDQVQGTTDAAGNMPFVGLRVYVNQTSDLNTQAVSVNYSWPGHTTRSGFGGSGGQIGAAVNENFLRAMQCWGDPVDSGTSDPQDMTIAQNVNYVASNTGPPRENCEYGTAGTISNFTVYQQGTRKADLPDPRKALLYGQETVYTDNVDTVDPSTGPVEIPFNAVDGTVVPHERGNVPYTYPNGTVTNYTPIVNPFFTTQTTNEQTTNILFDPDAQGGSQFQVQNATDSRGLGCGTEKSDGAGPVRCWLVLVPQADTDLDGAPFRTSKNPSDTSARTSSFGSPLASTNWRNRIAIPLTFNPDQTACIGGSGSHPMFGSALAQPAVLSWQNKLCGTADTIYDYTQGTDAIARSELGAGVAGMDVLSQPVDPSTTSSSITYAPLTLSGISIGFVWDTAKVTYQNTKFGTNFVSAAPGVPLAGIKLNQRLVAKLLTYSYINSNPYRILSSTTDQDPTLDYSWLGSFPSVATGYTPPGNNPQWLGLDSEFLQLNPELAPTTPDGRGLYQALQDVNISFLQGPLFASDGIAQLWKWIMADPDARRFMAGVADPWGTRVDPWFSTNPDVNPTGSAFDPDIDGLPYADPWQGIPNGTSLTCVPPRLAFSDIQPEAQDMSTVARDILSYNVLGKTAYDCETDPVSGRPPSWLSPRSTSVVIPGARGLAGLTDTASASQYGVTLASLQTAPAVPATATTPAKPATFVAPTDASISAAAANLTPTDVAGVSQPALTGTAGSDPAAYPLTLLTYAGVVTNGMSASDCAAFATFLDYAATTGQQSGSGVGQLPAGYVPLPATLRAQTAAAAQTVGSCPQDAVPDTPADTDAQPPVAEVSSVATDETPAETAAPASSAPTSAPQVSLASSQTKPDPSVFAYVVPLAALIGLLAVVVAPLFGLRRRKPGAPG